MAIAAVTGQQHEPHLFTLCALKIRNQILHACVHCLRKTLTFLFAICESSKILVSVERSASNTKRKKNEILSCVHSLFFTELAIFVNKT